MGDGRWAMGDGAYCHMTSGQPFVHDAPAISPIAHRPSPIAHRPSPIAHRPSSSGEQGAQRGVTQLVERFGLDLACAFARQTERQPDLFQGRRRAAFEPVA